MALRLGQALLRNVGELRFEPTAKLVTARVGGRVVLSTSQARLVWEPGRVVPYYAVPEEDLTADLEPSPDAVIEDPGFVFLPDGTRIVTPGRFDFHTTDGEVLTIRTDATELIGAAFRPADPDLTGYVVLDFDALDEWYEEDERIVAHPRDPFSWIDIRQSSRNVRIEVEGAVLADTTRPKLLFETGLPVRTYLPAEDVRMDLLEPTSTRTLCAYKGEASYLSFDGRDIAWTYEQPLPDSSQITGLVCFFDERVETYVDGERQEREWSPWS
ncbi:MAG: DUF427 domain-containing protein [Geodermatophilaceae bacterium]|nr:DUF427 domain-containing protein [Geodermatophilaceae bacterium]